MEYLINTHDMRNDFYSYLMENNNKHITIPLYSPWVDALLSRSVRSYLSVETRKRRVPLSKKGDFLTGKLLAQLHPLSHDFKILNCGDFGLVPSG